MRRTLTLPAVAATALTLAVAFPRIADCQTTDQFIAAQQADARAREANDIAERARRDSLLRDAQGSLDRSRDRRDALRQGTNQNGNSPVVVPPGVAWPPPDYIGPAPRTTVGLFFPEDLATAFTAGNIVAGDRMYFVALSSPSGITLRKFWGHDTASVREFYAKQYPTQRIVAIADSGFVVAP